MIGISRWHLLKPKMSQSTAGILITLINTSSMDHRKWFCSFWRFARICTSPEPGKRKFQFQFMVGHSMFVIVIVKTPVREHSSSTHVHWQQKLVDDPGLCSCLFNLDWPRHETGMKVAHNKYHHNHPSRSPVAVMVWWSSQPSKTKRERLKVFQCEYVHCSRESNGKVDGGWQMKKNDQTFKYQPTKKTVFFVRNSFIIYSIAIHSEPNPSQYIAPDSAINPVTASNIENMKATIPCSFGFQKPSNGQNWQPRPLGFWESKNVRVSFKTSLIQVLN